MHAEEPGQDYPSSLLLTPKKQGLDATSLHLKLWTELQRPPCTFPNFTAPLQESKHFFLPLACICLGQCHAPAMEQLRGSPRPRRCCAAFCCLVSPSSHPRAGLGAGRNLSRPSNRENDLQGWGPQASVQAVPINIKQRGCPRVLPRHLLSLGQVLALAWCQTVVPHQSPQWGLAPCAALPTAQTSGSSREGKGSSCSIQMGWPKEPGAPLCPDR